MTSIAVVPWWQNLLNGITGTVSADVQNWLVREYATLQAMPHTLSTFGNVQSQLTRIPAVVTDPTLGPSLSGIGVQLQGLTSQYPAMIGPVNTAYRSVQAAKVSGVSVSTGVDVAIAVAAAQQFTSGVSTVQNDLMAIVNQALASGAITPAQAASLNASLTTPNGAGWFKYVAYAAGAYVLWRLVRKVL